MRLIRAKTDKADSILIAHYAQLENPAQWAPTPQLLLEAAQEMTLVEQLIKQRTALLNQQDAFNQLPQQSQQAQNALNILLAGLNEQIDLLEKLVYTNQ